MPQPRSQLKLLQIVPYYKPAFVYGGPVISVGSLCEGLAAHGCDVTVYTTLANGSDELDFAPGEIRDVNGVKVRYFKRITGDFTHFSPSLLNYLNRTIRQYDVIHISGWWNFTSVLSCLVCLLNGVRPVVSSRGSLNKYTFKSGRSRLKRLIQKAFGRHLLQNSRMHFTVDEELHNAQSVMQPRDYFILPNYLDIQNGNVRANTNNSLQRLVFIGRIHRTKNIEMLIRAMSRMHVRSTLYIMGSGPEDYVNDLKQLARREGVEESISWLGHVNGQQKFDVIAGSTAFVLLSHAENFANTVVEALSVGVPVVVSEGVGMAEFVRKHNFGKVVKLDVDQVAQAIDELLKDTQLRKRVCQEAPELMEAEFYGERLIRKYIGEYEKLAHSGKMRMPNTDEVNTKLQKQ